MTRKWTARLVALGGLALALGCRSHPAAPPCAIPLMPEDVVNRPQPGPPGAGARLLPKTGILPPAPFTRLPESRPPVSTPSTPAPSADLPDIRPPADVAPLLVPQPPAGSGAGTPPEIKPLLVPAPRPPAGPDGFAPAPKIDLPDPPVPTAPVRPPVAEVKPPLPLAPGQRFGHARDYKWIAGVLDRHQKGGFWTLRYAPSGEDDPWGGKMRLLDDDRLTGFASGDVVYMEGELLAPPSAADTAAYPPYRVTHIRLVKKGR